MPVRLLPAVLLLSSVWSWAGAADIPEAPSAVATGDPTASRTGDPELETELFTSAASLPSRSIADYGNALLAPIAIAPAPVIARQPRRRVMDRNFLLLIGLGTALTIADYEMTQGCLARRICSEANPMLPTSRAGMYATNIPLNAALYFWSYKRKAAGKRLWWVAPLVIIGSHAAGIGTNVRFLGK